MVVHLWNIKTKTINIFNINYFEESLEDYMDKVDKTTDEYRDVKELPEKLNVILNKLDKILKETVFLD